MIGIIADTHDHMKAIRKAVKFFNSKKVELVLHAGDFIAPFTVREFKNLNARLIGVFGNNDGERRHLKENYLSQMHTELKEVQEVELRGKKIFLYHGTNEQMIRIAIKSERYDVVIRGHTHKPEVNQEGKTLVTNPGEACGYLSGKKTVALLDLEKLKAKIVKLR